MNTIDELRSDHEEADKKLIALVKAANMYQDKSVIICSISDDIDILVLFVVCQFNGIKVLIDSGTGKRKKDP